MQDGVSNTRPMVWCDVEADDALVRAWPALRDHVTLAGPRSTQSAAHLRLLEEAWFVIARQHRLGADEFERMPGLKAVTAWGVGYNHIDVSAATARRIPVSINPVFTNSVAEASMALVLALAKRLPQLSELAKTPVALRVDGEQVPRNTELAGKTFGLVGFGRIGRATGHLAHSFGMHVLAADPAVQVSAMPDWARLVELHELLAESHVVVVLAPLTPATRHLIGREQLEAMRPGAFLVNVARGGLVDEQALFDALTAGHLGGAGLDVWEREPVAPDHPLLELPTVIGTSHNLARSEESLERICQSIVSNIQKVLAGEQPDNMINPEAWEARR